MNILMLCDKLGVGGAETHVLTLTSGLIEKGFKIKLISAGGIYEEKLSRMGVECIYAPLDKRDPFSIRKSYQVIKRHLPECDLVHAHTRLTAYLATRARGRYKLPRIVVTAHLNFNTKGVGALSRWGDITLSVSEDISEYLVREYGVERDKIILTKNGIDLKEYEGSNNDKKRIVHVSRIDEGRAKTAFLLCEIAPKLLKKYPEFVIDIWGSGTKLEDLRHEAERANQTLNREAVRVRGSTDNVAEVLSKGGIFVGASRAALEAMAMSLPTVIAGDEGYGGILCKENFPFLKKSNLCARGCENTNSDNLRRDIERLIEDHGMRRDCARFGRETVVTLYSKESMTEDCISAYRLARSGVKAAVMGYFGFGNLGDEKTLEVILNVFSKRGIICSGIISKSSGGRKISEVISILKKSDALILGGGNLLQNETSNRSLLYYLSIMALSMAMKKRVIMCASGIGKIKGRSAELILRFIIPRCYKIGARTTFDLESFLRLGARHTALMPDLCFTLPEQASGKPEDSFLLILKSGRDIKQDFIRGIRESTGLLPIATTLCQTEKLSEIKALCESIGIPLYLIRDYGELCDTLSKCRFTVSERLHGAIFSLVNHKVCYIIDAYEKNLALYEEISQRCKRLSLPDVLIACNGNDYRKIKEVGAKSSDFDEILFSLKEDIYSALDGQF